MVAGRSLKSGPTSWLLLAAFGVGVPAVASDVATGLPPAGATPELERALVEGMLELRKGDLDAASARLDALIERQPDFRLAHLIRGDVWMAQATGLSTFGQGVDGDQRVADLLFEARARWARYRNQSPPSRAMPKGLLRVPERAPSVIVVDLLGNRLFLFENHDGQVRKTLDFYVSIGKGGTDKRLEGDERTPVGFYLVSEYLDGQTLPDLYGVGAFPINYPNGWDRLRGRTGSGIWIHGTESTTYSRPPRSSRGCVTLSNEDFRRLMDSVEISETPVLVTNGFDWVPRQRNARDLRDVEEQVELWRLAWESRDVGRYLSFYSDEFSTQGMDLMTFGEHKRRVAAGKQYIRINLGDVGIYAYPGEAGLVVVDFVQHYRSDSFESSRRKHQYWRLQAGAWRIVFEEGV